MKFALPDHIAQECYEECCKSKFAAGKNLLLGESFTRIRGRDPQQKMEVGRSRWQKVSNLDNLPLMVASMNSPKNVGEEVCRICYTVFLNHREELVTMQGSSKPDKNMVWGEVVWRKEFGGTNNTCEGMLSLADNKVSTLYPRKKVKEVHFVYFQEENGEVYPMCRVCHNHILVHRPTTDKVEGTMVCPIGCKRFDSDET